MSKPQIIKTQSGEELVVISRRDYDSMRARLGDEEAEDAMDARILKERAGDIAFPLSVWDEIDASPSPVRPLRQWRKLTQEELAAKADISQGYLSEIETGKKTGDVTTLRAIATALGVGLDDVTHEVVLKRAKGKRRRS
jgi:DNA-binding XRE family transcriptional regulator/PHD/YefM family antitoxin component YafN of YafNO toxin-antitoxin module